MVAILSVPCFATNEGTYGHYISPGHYVFNEQLDALGANNIRIYFDFKLENYNYLFNSIVYADNVLYVYGDSLDVNIGTVYNKSTGWVKDDYRHIIIPNGFFITDSYTYLFFVENLTRIDGDYQASLLDEFLSLFMFIGQWISGAAEDLTAMFWLDNSLTLVGTLAVASLAMAVSFLIIGLISRFLHFRG